MKNKKKSPKLNPLISLLYKSFLTFSIFLILFIISSTSPERKEEIHNLIYEKSFLFTKFASYYNKYLGGIYPINLFNMSTTPVSQTVLSYNNYSVYLDGIKLEVDNSYLIPNLQSGVVVYVGTKEKYGNVVIIQGKDNIEITYGNIKNISVNIYDTIEQGSWLGEADGNYFYLLYSYQGKTIDYRKYFP